MSPHAAQPFPSPDLHLHLGRVVRVDRSGVVLVPIAPGAGGPGAVTPAAGLPDGLVGAAGGDPVAAVLTPRLAAAGAEERPVTGDLVDWGPDADGRAVVRAVHERRTLLARAGAGRDSGRQLLAANVDVVVVAEPLVPYPDRHRIDRLLTLAWSSGAEPVIVLTKADLAPDAAAVAAEVELRCACRVVAASAVAGDGLDQLRALLDGGRVLALLGPSGAGKSSLVNALAGHDAAAVQQVRRDGKGRHTTVTRDLHPVAGGFVVDGPGMRSVGLAGADGVDSTFADVVELAARCRFGDCGHESEPGCAVLDAVDDGSLDPDRLASWRQLLAEGRYEERRRDARLRSEHNRQVRTMHRAMRRRGNRP